MTKQQLKKTITKVQKMTAAQLEQHVLECAREYSRVCTGVRSKKIADRLTVIDSEMRLLAAAQQLEARNAVSGKGAYAV